MRGINTHYGAAFTFQWHLTTRCNYRCRHCYNSDSAADFDAGLLRAGIDCLESFYAGLSEYCKKEVRKCVVITGGDPLLYPEFRKLMPMLDKKGYHLGILGCPDTFGRETRDFLLNETGCRSIQFSIDGPGKKHDLFRNSPGAFQRTIDKALELQESFKVNIMATVCRETADEIPELVFTLADCGIENFDFARLAHTGNAAGMTLMRPDRHRSFLKRMLECEQRLSANGSQLKIGKKDPLWRLLLYETGDYKIPDTKNKIASGCPCGYTSLTILPDGRLWICRRCESQVGRFPDDDIFEIYMNNPLLRRWRNCSSYEGCAICRLKTVCRGCPAVGASYYGTPFRRDPQCWRIVLP